MESVGSWSRRDSRMGALVVMTRSKIDRSRWAGTTEFCRAFSTCCWGTCLAPTRASAMMLEMVFRAEGEAKRGSQVKRDTQSRDREKAQHMIRRTHELKMEKMGAKQSHLKSSHHARPFNGYKWIARARIENPQG